MQQLYDIHTGKVGLKTYSFKTKLKSLRLKIWSRIIQVWKPVVDWAGTQLRLIFWSTINNYFLEPGGQGRQHVGIYIANQ